MAQVDYYIRLDLKKEHEQGVQHIKYGDANTRVLRFFVHSGGKTYDISDKHVILHFLKSDGTSGSVRCFHAAEKGTCYCIVSSQMSAVAGEVKCDLKIYSGDTLVHSPKFYLLVGTDALSGDTSADVFGDEKADKVESAAAGNFAGLDVEGNLTDSGKKASDFAAAEHDHTYGDITDFASGVAEYAPPGSEIIFPLVYMTDNTPAPFEEGEYWYAPTAGKLYVTVSVPGSGLSWDDVTNSKLKENNLFVYRTGRVYYCVGTELRETKAVPEGHTHTKSAITDFAHTHAQSDISGLSDALAGKAAASHSHTMADVENLDVAIGSKASKNLTAEEDNFASFDNSGDIQDSGKNASDFAAASHTHTLSQITGLPVPTAADAGKSLVVTALGKFILSDGSNHTVTLNFDDDYSPGSMYIESPNGTKYHGDQDEDDSFGIIDGDTVHCYVDYSEMDNIISVNGVAVAGMYGGPAEYDLKVTGNVSITATANPGSYGRIEITMYGASKTATLSNTSSYSSNCFVEYDGNQYYTQGDTITIPAGSTLRCYANCGPSNYLYVNGSQIVGGTGALDYAYTVTSDITVQFEISIASYGAIRITTN